MTAKNKRRGNDFEREVVKTAQHMGLDAKRAWGSDGRSLGRTAGVDVIMGDQDFQCKRRKRVAGYLIPEGDVDGVIFRQDGSLQAYVILRLEDYVAERVVCRRIMDQLRKAKRLDVTHVLTGISSETDEEQDERAELPVGI